MMAIRKSLLSIIAIAALLATVICSHVNNNAINAAASFRSRFNEIPTAILDDATLITSVPQAAGWSSTGGEVETAAAALQYDDGLSVVSVLQGVSPADVLAARQISAHAGIILTPEYSDIQQSVDGYTISSLAYDALINTLPNIVQVPSRMSTMTNKVLLSSGLSSRIANAVFKSAVLYKNVSFSHLQRTRLAPSIAAKIVSDNQGASVLLGIDWSVVTTRGGVLVRDIEVDKCVAQLHSKDLAKFSVNDMSDRMFLLETCAHLETLSRLAADPVTFGGVVVLDSASLAALNAEKKAAAMVIMNELYTNAINNLKVSVSGVVIVPGGRSVPSVDAHSSIYPAEYALHYPFVFMAGQCQNSGAVNCINGNDVAALSPRADNDTIPWTGLTEAGHTWAEIYKYQVIFWTVIGLIVITAISISCMCASAETRNDSVQVFARRSSKKHN